MRKGLNKSDVGLMAIILFVGFPIFLLMEHPALFWLVLVPLSLILIVSLVKWFRGDSVKYLIISFVMFFSLFPFMIIASNLDKCEHEEIGTLFSFQFENSIAASDVKSFCNDCGQSFKITQFHGTPTDVSYLETVNNFIDGNEIVAGEYYTMKAVVSVADHDINKTRVRCKVENEDVTVGFSVEFREGFEEQISLLQKGDEITFRGRLYDNGFGWTDCELLEI